MTISLTGASPSSNLQLSYKRKRDDDNESPEISKKTKSFPFVYDQFTEARGAPKMLEITCAKCNKWILDYQKDGPGKLLRMYVDRIYHPKALREYTFSTSNIQSISPLKCWSCKKVLAKPIIYHRKHPSPETRPAYSILNTKSGPSINLQERIK